MNTERNATCGLVALALTLAACDSSFLDTANDSETGSAPLTQDDREISVARIWNEVLLEGIRNDYARPTVHARNLWHSSAAMYDAWAAYDDTASTWLLGKTQAGFDCHYDAPSRFPRDIQRAREEAVSFAAYRIAVRSDPQTHTPSPAQQRQERAAEALSLSPPWPFGLC